MNTKTATSYIRSGLPFVASVAAGGIVGNMMSKHNKTLGWAAGLLVTAFGLGWSISLANSSPEVSNQCECAGEFMIRTSALNNESSRQLYTRKYGKEVSNDSALSFCNNDATVK